jgi:hypothetical protein
VVASGEDGMKILLSSDFWQFVKGVDDTVIQPGFHSRPQWVVLKKGLQHWSWSKFGANR